MLKDSLLIVHYSVFEIILSKKQISIVDTPFCPKTSILGLIVNRDGSSCHFFVVFLSLAFCVGGCPEPCVGFLAGLSTLGLEKVRIVKEKVLIVSTSQFNNIPLCAYFFHGIANRKKRSPFKWSVCQ